MFMEAKSAESEVSVKVWLKIRIVTIKRSGL